jgi:uncharacterized protein DUF5071
MATDLSELVPKHKFDLGTAQEAVAAGFPTVAPILPDLMKWIQDCNWPVAHILAPFLASIGEPLLPEVRRVLETTDGVWKYWTLARIVAHWPKDLIVKLRPELLRLGTSPTPSEREDEVDVYAREILIDSGLS